MKGMPRALAALMVLVAIGEVAEAQVVNYLHEGEPAFSLEYPPGWEVRTPLDPERPLISATPRDGSMLWHGVWILADSSTEDAGLAQLKALGARLFTDIETPLEPWTETYGDLTVRCQAGRGLYKGDQQIGIFLGVFEVGDDQIGAFMYMGDVDAIATHEADMAAMLASLEVMR